MASQEVISQRAENMFSFEFPLKAIFDRLASNPFHETDNKEGIINLNTAYNEAVRDIITDKMNQQDAQEWETSMLPYPKHCAGLLRLRQAIANFLANQLNANQPIDPDKLCVMCGVTPILNVIAFILCNPGDTILTPSPMYGGIPRDIMYQSGVKAFPVHLSSQGHKVKALFLVNPYNPLGTVFIKQQVIEYLTFCDKHNLHCVVDEIYCGSIYDDSIKNSSIFSFDPEELPDKNKTHVLWGMAKDFGMPGCPVGVVHTCNPMVLSALIGLNDFYQVSLFIQKAVAKLLEDKEWLKSYIPTHNSMLVESSSIVKETLDGLGVPYVKPSAGLFLWADFRKFIPDATKESEISFAEHCLDNGVAISPGSAFYYNEFGWFRLIHALPNPILVEAMKRLKASCESFQG